MNAPPPPPYAQQPQYPPQQPQQGYPQQGYPQQPPPKKSNRGCLIALAIVGGLILLGGIGTAVAAFAFMHSDAGKKIVSAVSSGTQLAAEAQNAPGTSELRAIGCGTALVMDVDKIQAFTQIFGDAGVTTSSPDIRLVVTCQARVAGTPTCDQAAATYAKAV